MNTILIPLFSQAISFITAGTISAGDVVNILGWGAFNLLTKIQG